MRILTLTAGALILATMPIAALSETEDTADSVRAALAKEILQPSVAISGYKWNRNETNSRLVRDSKILNKESGVKKVKLHVVANVGSSAMMNPTQSAFKWGIRSTSEQSAFKWGIRSSADQSAFKWGIRSSADQSAFKWGIRSSADQSAFKWGIRSSADQSAFKWGIRSSVDQAAFKWGIRSAADQSAFKWGIR